MDMANMSLLNTEEKVVQMCDIINLMDARIKELEAEVTRLKADDKTLAFGEDVGNLKDFEEELPPVPLKEEKKEDGEEEEREREESLGELTLRRLAHPRVVHHVYHRCK